MEGETTQGNGVALLADVEGKGKCVYCAVVARLKPAQNLHWNVILNQRNLKQKKFFSVKINTSRSNRLSFGFSGELCPKACDLLEQLLLPSTIIVLLL